MNDSILSNIIFNYFVNLMIKIRPASQIFVISSFVNRIFIFSYSFTIKGRMYNADHLTIITFLLMCEIQWLLNLSINPPIGLTLSSHFNQNQSVIQHQQKASENQRSHVHHKYVSLTSWIINYRSRKSRSSGSLR